MFKITKENIHKVMIKALHEIDNNPIHSKWLLEFNLNLAFSSHVSFILARDYETVLNERDFSYLMWCICKHYIEYVEVYCYETR